MAAASGPRSSDAVVAKAPHNADNQARACCRSAARFLCGKYAVASEKVCEPIDCHTPAGMLYHGLCVSCLPPTEVRHIAACVVLWTVWLSEL